MKSEFIIQAISENGISQLKEISDEEFGLNYIEYHEFIRFCKGANFVGIQAIHKGKAIGFSIMEICNIDQLILNINLEESFLRAKFSLSQPICFRKHTVVKKEFQHLGVGQKLIQESINIASERSKSMISVVWEKEEGFNFGKLLHSFGFELLLKVENYWTEESLRKNYNCSKCGYPPCICKAIIYARFFV